LSAAATRSREVVVSHQLVAHAPSDLPVPFADPALVEALSEPRLSLFWGAETTARTLLAVATALAGRGQLVRIFDGGNRFDGYFVARLARQLVGNLDPRLPADPHVLLGRIRLSRAFTCFQLAELIENAPAGPEPLFVLEMLSTFYDESIPLADSERLLTTTIAHLKRLAATGPVIIGAREPQTLVKDRWALLDRLQAAADASWLLQLPQPTVVTQPGLPWT
jgi:hypothetical protein